MLHPERVNTWTILCKEEKATSAQIFLQTKGTNTHHRSNRKHFHYKFVTDADVRFNPKSKETYELEIDCASAQVSFSNLTI